MEQDLFGKQNYQATPEVGGLLDAIVSKPALIHGDCLEIMRTAPAESIDLTVTSPPYDNLREYLLDKFVIWRYDIPYEKKQEIIRELRERGIKPVAPP